MTIFRQEFLARLGLQEATLAAWLDDQWLKPFDGEGGISFTEVDIARVRLIRDLQVDLGVNDEGVGVVLHLIDQLYGIRRSFLSS